MRRDALTRSIVITYFIILASFVTSKVILASELKPCPRPAVDVVEKILKYWTKGDYTSPLLYWTRLTEYGEDTYTHLLNVKGYEIVNTNCYSYEKYNDAIITVRVQSTTQGGSPIEKLWKFGLLKYGETWKVSQMVEGESLSLEAFREDMIKTLKESEQKPSESRFEPKGVTYTPKDIHVEGIVTGSGGRYKAMIKGELYGEGSYVDGVKIEKINPSSVDVIIDGTRKRLPVGEKY